MKEKRRIRTGIRNKETSKPAPGIIKKLQRAGAAKDKIAIRKVKDSKEMNKTGGMRMREEVGFL